MIFVLQACQNARTAIARFTRIDEKTIAKWWTPQRCFFYSIDTFQTTSNRCSLRYTVCATFGHSTNAERCCSRYALSNTNI